MKKISSYTLILSIVFFFTACGALYNWDEKHHIDGMYTSLHDNDKSKMQDLITPMSDYLLKLENKGKKAPPTAYAFLGYLYIQVDDYANAFKNFNKEKALYPQSAHFLDYLMSRKGAKQ